MAEFQSCKLGVVGSNPTGGSKKSHWGISIMASASRLHREREGSIPSFPTNIFALMLELEDRNGSNPFAF